MNEILFFIEILIIIGFAFWALRLGKVAMTSWIVIQAIIANLFVLKQINLFGLEVTATDVFAVGSLLGLNFLQEYFSKEDAAKATWICFFCMVFFALVSQLHLLYQPSVSDVSHAAFAAILSPNFRLLAASMGVFFIVQRVDILFFDFLKKSMTKTSFALRAGLCLIFSQFLDTFLFGYAGLYGIVESLFDIILFSYLIKLLVIFCFIACVRIAKS